MVIKLIHQIWVGPNKMPDVCVNYIKQIKELHPDYEHRLWTDEDLTEENFSNLEYIKSTPIYAQKADIMRYEILYKHGGIYLDTDFEIFKPLTPLLTHDLVVCNEDWHVDLYMTNAFIYSIPGTENFKNCIDNIKHCILGGQVCVAKHTGPWYFRSKISLARARVLPSAVMYPIHFTYDGKYPESYSPETYGCHHWHKSW